MNLFFGFSGPGAEPALANASAHIHRHFASEPTIVRRGDTLLGWISDDGAVLGTATSGDHTLVLLGTILPPLPDAAPLAPLDDPNALAAWLLARHTAVGEQFCDGLIGQYTLAIFNAASGEMLFASDAGGGRSLFVHRDGQNTAFASNIGVAGAMLGSCLKVNKEHEDFMLLYGFYPFGTTVYRDILVQPAGDITILRADQTDRASIALAEPKIATPLPQTEDEAVDALHDAMMAALTAMLPAKKQKVAVLLGGFDSALVAAAIHRLGYRVETYSFRYADAGFNQPFCEELAQTLGITHHWIAIDQAMIEAGMERFAHCFNQPTNWPNYVIQTAMVVQQMRRDGHRYCYSGDGCDAVFLGYPGTAARARLIAHLPELPEPLHSALLTIAANPLAERHFGHPYRVALGLLRGLGRSSVARDYLSFRIMDEVTLKQIHAESDYRVSNQNDNIVETLAAPHEALPTLRRAFLGKAAVSPNRSKMLASADMTGIPILSPYMHPDLKKLAVSLPVDLMRPSDPARQSVTGKYILMKMAEDKGLLSADIIYQPKMAAVDAPIDDWYAGEMRGAMLRWLSDLPFEPNIAALDRLLDTKAAEKLFRKHVMTDKVISHAPSLLATYARFAAKAA
jgi:asparagine synthetase B (glutamine-hydrolysing)